MNEVPARNDNDVDVAPSSAKSPHAKTACRTSKVNFKVKFRNGVRSKSALVILALAGSVATAGVSSIAAGRTVSGQNAGNNTQGAQQAQGASGSAAQGAPAGSRREKVANPLNDLLDEAQRDIEKKDFAAAIDPLQKFIAEQPDVAYGHFELAYVYTALQKSAEARAEYERTIAIDPKMAEAYLNLGILFIDRDPALAVPNLKNAVDLLPSQSRPRYLLGVAQEHAGDIPAAAESFEGAYRLDHHDLEPVLHLAGLYLRLGRTGDAEAKFRGALEIEANNAGAMLGLAECLDAEKKPEAADAYRKYLAAQSSDAKARGRLVHLLVDRQQYDVAAAELDRADAGQAPNTDSLRLRADIQIAQKKYDDAIVTLNKAIALDPRDAQLHGGLGRIYIQKRDFPAALKELKIALALDRKNPTYWKDLSTAFYLSGNWTSTIATLDEIAKTETPGAGPWFIRALCYDKLNQAQLALDAYQKFLSLDQGKNPDQEWQAQERSKVLRKVLEHKR
jgi:tetratricopeptide (TPR) repeat protein